MWCRNLSVPRGSIDDRRGGGKGVGASFCSVSNIRKVSTDILRVPFMNRFLLSVDFSLELKKKEEGESRGLNKWGLLFTVNLKFESSDLLIADPSTLLFSWFYLIQSFPFPPPSVPSLFSFVTYFILSSPPRCLSFSFSQPPFLHPLSSLRPLSLYYFLTFVFFTSSSSFDFLCSSSSPFSSPLYNPLTTN